MFSLRFRSMGFLEGDLQMLSGGAQGGLEAIKHDCLSSGLNRDKKPLLDFYSL